MKPTGNKRIAINTAFMYGRMLLVMFFSLIASRLLLSTLGVTDYGIYSVVGSITVTFIAIKGLFSESIQRFLNVAKGRQADSLLEQQQIFYIGLIIHFLLAIVFLALTELIGTWLIETKLSIPSDRIDAAYFVFHVSIIATVIGIINIPYEAVVIANEKMGFYAFLSLYEGLARLLIILLLPIIGYDYLKTYSLFLLLTPSSSLIVLLYYCRKFPECSYHKNFNKKIFKEIASLSGWNFCGNICFSLIHEGINFLLNIYGCIVLNAARAISYQIKNMAGQVSTNTLIAVRPRIMQQSSQIDKNKFFEDIVLLSRISFFSLALVIYPLFLYCPYLLKIWLGEFPEETILFTRLILVALFIRSLHEPINMMNMTYSCIKRQVIFESIVMLLAFGSIFILFQITDDISMPFNVLILMEIVVVLVLIINAKHELGFPLTRYIKKVIVPMVLLFGYSFFTGAVLTKVVVSESVYFNIFMILFSVLISALGCFLLLDRREKQIIKSLISR